MCVCVCVFTLKGLVCINRTPCYSVRILKKLTLTLCVCVSLTTPFPHSSFNVFLLKSAGIKSVLLFQK